MPKKKITEIVRALPKAKASSFATTKPAATPAATMPGATRLKTTKLAATKLEAPRHDVTRQPPAPPAMAANVPVKENNAGVKAAFENKAGKYELIRVDGDQAHYSFTNLQAKTVDATMSVVMWQRMQARADSTLKETA